MFIKEDKMVKSEIRILGIDDSPFTRKDKKVLCIGTIYRGGNYIDGLISFEIDKDGDNATKNIIKSFKKTRHRNQLRYIMVDGLTLGGFNIIDIKKIYSKTKTPCIVVMRKKPKMKKFLKAIEKTSNPDKKKKIVEKAGKIQKTRINGKDIYLQLAGIDLEKTKKILKLTCIHSDIPDPLRVSHIIASGVKLGDSHGGA